MADRSADYSERALLPEGFHDDLPPDAEYEASIGERLLARFYAFGYERVSPPLVEFEESLLAGSGRALSRQMFRLMDPASQRMMGIRTDMTIQVARIAGTRLAAAARPLRLCYAGQVLRVRGGQLRSERQFGQAGIELIGAPSLEADAEVLLIAADSLQGLGVEGLSVDLTVPSLVPQLAAELGMDADQAEAVRTALNAKDIGALQAFTGRAGELFRGLLAAAGPADGALPALRKLGLPDGAAAICADLEALVARLGELAPGLAVTVDPGECRGFEYQTGIAFTLFAARGRGELGRGGRYMIPGGENGGETATGVTLYLDSLLRVLPRPEGKAKVYLPWGTSLAEVREIQSQGWRVVRALAADADAVAAARAQGCCHILEGGRVRPLE